MYTSEYWEVHEAEWEAQAEWEAFEADMATNPYGEREPDLEAMASEWGW